MRDSKRLVSLFRSLSESRQQALLDYAEFLAGKEGAETASAPPAEPLPIPRPEQENVVKAIQRLMQTYPMLERNQIFHEASAQMTRHLVHGVAAGGGLELALACDLRIVTADARLSLPEVGLGTVPGWGGTERLTDLVGRARAKQVVLARQTLDGPTALAWGLAAACVPPDDIDAAVDDLAGRLRGAAPVAVQLAKQLVDAAADGAPARVLETLAGGLASATGDLAEGVRAFREGRAPRFTGQ